MPIFVYDHYDLLTESAEDAHVIPCESLARAEHLAGELCNGAAACAFSQDEQIFRVRCAGFGHLSSSPGVTSFVFEAGATLRCSKDQM